LAHHKARKGLFLWGDNDPYNIHANLVLPHLVNCTLGGCDTSQQLLAYGSPTVSKQFDQSHLVFAGVNSLYEGHTICFPSPSKGKTSYDLQVLATSSDNKPCILCRDSSDKAGRILVDTGFTKLYMQWTTAGQSRYVVNASVWLVDVENRGD